MKPSWKHRSKAALWCLRGNGVLFNVTFNEGETFYESNNPPLLVSNCRFIGKASLTSRFYEPLDKQGQDGVT